jgi:FG-GAP repeat protein
MKLVLLTSTLIALAASLQAQCDIEVIPQPSNQNGDLLPIVLGPGLVITAASGFAGKRVINVYEDTEWGWVLMDTLEGSDVEPGDGFGFVMALEDDIVMLGARFDDEAGEDAGAVYVFERSSPFGWVQTQKLLQPDPTGNDYFGGSISMSGDLAVLGAGGHNSPQGAAYVYRRVAGSWMLEAKLEAGGGNSGIGSVSAVSGNRILLGAAWDDEQGVDAGAVYVFEYSGGSWSLTSKLFPQQSIPEENFGRTLALEGDTILVGAPSGTCGSQRRVLVFAAQGPTWSEVAELFAPPSSDGGNFGKNLALEGNVAIISSGCSVNPKEELHWFINGPDGWAWGGNTAGGLYSLALSGRRAAVSGGPLSKDVKIFTVPDSAIEFCFCGAAAPCANEDLVGGCTNSTGTGGRLLACGTSGVARDDLVLTAEGLPPNQFGLIFMGPGAISPVPFQDGLRCVGGPLYRFPMQGTGADGNFAQGPGMLAWTQANLPGGATIAPGETWAFQAWYRDPLGPCGSDSNATHGVKVTFHP